MNKENIQFYDYVVIGAGIEGSATAYWLSKNGHKTLLLEQFKLPHSNGSSHGGSRVTRKAYNEDVYAKMMVEAYPLWDQLAAESGEKLFENCGVLFVADPKYHFANKYANVMDQNKFRYSLYNGAQIKRNIPNLTNIPDNWQGLYDPEGGVLLADKCLHSFQKLFARNGGTIHDNEKVSNVFPYTNFVKIETDKNRYQCKSVIICIGAWSGNFLKEKLQCNLPLEPEEITVCYYKEKCQGRYLAIDGSPVVLLFDEDGDSFFMLPQLEYHGLVKVGYDFGSSIDPDNRKNENYNKAIEKLKSCISRFYPDLHNEPAIIQKCLYTHTPDRHFILDKHPVYKNVVIGAGFSGHGFKLAPVVGKILSDLAIGIEKTYNYDVNELKIARFANYKPKLSADGITHHLL